MAISMIHEDSASISRCTYHVFLSFRGADTRKNFTDHLYSALVQAGICTFRDEKIERGKNIKNEIEKVILHQSRISIIVFSKDYASSTWCVNELVKIMEHRKSSQHIVLPVFYHVDPTQIKKQTGSYAEAFSRHEESFKSEMELVKRWRAALKEVADLGGMVLQDRHESQFIQDIVKEVQNKLKSTILYVPTYLAGIDSLVTRINRWLEKDRPNKVGIATICGIGGIGKTTIAKVVYNQNIQRFEGHSFLADVRETSEKCNGLVRLQRQLISDIIKGKTQKIYNADDGINKIKEAICCRRVLLVLDDVDDLEKITKMIGTQIPFHPGSKIIITTRHRYLLTASFIGQMFNLEASFSFGDFCKIFEVKELAFKESLQLFNWYSFGHNSITESFMEYASKIVKHCGGLPLALQVLGSSLFEKSPSVWKSAMEKLEAILDSKIQKILRLSYDSLQDDHDKNLFLDIACLFIGKDREYATTILDGCDFYTTVGIENLINRSLLIVNEKNKLMMHQMVRNMAREIIRQESPDLGKRSRLWHQDALNVIKEKIGSKTIKCLTLDHQELLEDKSRKTTASLHFGKHSKNRFVMSNEIDMETEAFAKMKRLKLLQLDFAKLKGDFKDFPKGLIWLRWHGFPRHSLPMDFDIKRLVVLDIRNSSLKHVLKDKECLPALKILNLSHSHCLLKTPNFSRLPSLEKLILKDCIKLIEVDQSIGELKKLTFLSLKECKNIKKLPRTIGLLASIEVLILSGCSRLEDVPRELHNIKSLRVLNLDRTAINQSKLWMSWLSLKGRKELSHFWASLPCSLVKLSLESCKLSDDVMPSDFSSLPLLKCLNLSGNPFCNLPESIKNLKKLDELRLTSCTKLQVIPKLPIIFSNLVEVYRSMLPNMIVRGTLPCLFSSKRCVIFGCERLIEVQDVFKLEPIENFEAKETKILFNMDCIDNNEMQLYNYLTDTKIVVTPQVLFECNIISTFIPGSEVPFWFEHRAKGSQITFSLPAPSHLGEEIKSFNLCIVFSIASDQNFEFQPSLFIINETKEIRRGYCSSFIGIPKTNNNTMLWLIHWPTTGFQLEDGDFVSCTVAHYFHLNVREFGVTCEFENNIKYEYDFPHYHPGNKDVTGVMELITERLINLDSYENVKVQICNYSEESRRVTSPQVLYDCGLITSFDLNNDVPFYRAGWPAQISITVPQKASQKISWLKLIIILSTNNDKTFEFLARIEIVNKSKDTRWTYSKHFDGIPETKNTLYWLTSWKFRGDEVEAGDHISLTVLSDLCVLEFGIDIVYDYEAGDKCISLDDQSQCAIKSSIILSAAFVCHLFKSQRTLYRMQRLVKE